MSFKPKFTESDAKRAVSAYSMAMASVGAQVGCVTVLIIFIALGVGLWLDGIFHTKPTITIALMLGSIPITLGAMFWIVRSTTKRILTEQEPEPPLDDEKN